MIAFRQPIHPGDKGRDVLAVKRAFLKMKAQDSKQLVVKGPKASTAGKAFVHVVKAVEHNRGLPHSGFYDARLHRIVAPYMDAYGRLLYRTAAIRHPPLASAQNRILDYVRWAMDHRGLIGYAQRRPMHSSTRHLPMDIDCSEFATLTYKDAQLPDPNGNHFNGSGNTSTLRAHGSRVSVAQIGDLAFYEHPDHVGVYVHAGVIGRAEVVEHGSDPGPRYEPDDYRPIVEVRRYPIH
jgi:cell wall-associated NlpC family hydrolase